MRARIGRAYVRIMYTVLCNLYEHSDINYVGALTMMREKQRYIWANHLIGKLGLVSITVSMIGGVGCLSRRVGFDFMMKVRNKNMIIDHRRSPKKASSYESYLRFTSKS